MHEIDLVKKIENDFDKFWIECDSYENQITTKSFKKLLKTLKKKL